MVTADFRFRLGAGRCVDCNWTDLEGSVRANPSSANRVDAPHSCLRPTRPAAPRCLLVEAMNRCDGRGRKGQYKMCFAVGAMAACAGGGCPGVVFGMRSGLAGGFACGWGDYAWQREAGNARAVRLGWTESGGLLRQAVEL
jgi:hypothetical protein